jgi:hemolysin activation/secretion protein
LRQTLWSRVQGVIFYDAGSVKVNKEPFGQTTRNRRTLSGAGLGVNAMWSGVQMKASAAWPVHGGDPTSIPVSENHSPTFWLQASVGI